MRNGRLIGNRYKSLIRFKRSIEAINYGAKIFEERYVTNMDTYLVDVTGYVRVENLYHGLRIFF